jgi:hypothetical protein
LEALDLDHLHLDDVVRAARVGTLDIQDRQLEVMARRQLLGSQVVDIDDPMRLVQFKQRVEQLQQQVLVRLLPEDLLKITSVLGSAKTGLGFMPASYLRHAVASRPPRRVKATP